MSKKCEVLKSVKGTIETNGVIRGNYSNPTSGKCCAVGYILMELGMDIYELEILHGSVNTIMSKRLMNKTTLQKNANTLLANEGFTVQEMSVLQVANDTDTLYSVTNAIDGILVSNQCN